MKIQGNNAKNLHGKCEQRIVDTLLRVVTKDKQTLVVVQFHFPFTDLHSVFPFMYRVILLFSTMLISLISSNFQCFFLTSSYTK